MIAARPTRRVHSLAVLAVGWSLMLFSNAGCHALRHHKECEEPGRCQCCSNVEVVPRRIYVIVPGPDDPRDLLPGLGGEIVAALNATPECQAMLIPPEQLPAPPGAIPGAIPEHLLHHPDGPSLTAAIDEILIVQVVDVQPFRPMQLTAFIERRLAIDGSIISQEHRTWNAPTDMEPLSPDPFNRRILSRPPPLGAVEHHELSRLSPRTFYRNVAKDVAAEIAGIPEIVTK